MSSFVAYYRVSTARQGQSGLGLDAQRAAVSGFLHNRGDLAGEFTEVESGRKSNRPQLAAALDCAAAAALCWSSPNWIVWLATSPSSRASWESGVEFVAVDNPHANKLMLHMLAAFAEHERDQISARTLAALAAAKARGFALAILGWKKWQRATGP